jgi:excisionase family DNA binding protein
MLRNLDLLTMSEVAEMLQCSKAHVSNVVAGRVRGCAPIPAVRLGRRRLIRRTSLEAWIAENDRVTANDERKPAGREAGRETASLEQDRRSA